PEPAADPAIAVHRRADLHRGELRAHQARRRRHIARLRADQRQGPGGRAGPRGVGDGAADRDSPGSGTGARPRRMRWLLVYEAGPEGRYGCSRFTHEESSWTHSLQRSVRKSSPTPTGSRPTSMTGPTIRTWSRPGPSSLPNPPPTSPRPFAGRTRTGLPSSFGGWAPAFRGAVPRTRRASCCRWRNLPISPWIPLTGSLSPARARSTPM